MLTSGVQNCNRVLKQMIQCVVFVSWSPPPHVHLTSIWHHSRDECSQAFPVLHQLCITVNANEGGLGTRLGLVLWATLLSHGEGSLFNLRAQIRLQLEHVTNYRCTWRKQLYFKLVEETHFTAEHSFSPFPWASPMRLCDIIKLFLKPFYWQKGWVLDVKCSYDILYTVGFTPCNDKSLLSCWCVLSDKICCSRHQTHFLLFWSRSVWEYQISRPIYMGPETRLNIRTLHIMH